MAVHWKEPVQIGVDSVSRDHCGTVVGAFSKTGSSGLAIGTEILA